MKTRNRIRRGWLENWLRKRRHERMLNAYGGTQTCPWCDQLAQDEDGAWSFSKHHEHPQLDVLTCGVCKGRSLWFWGLGMHYLRPLDHPAMDLLEPTGRYGDEG